MPLVDRQKQIPNGMFYYEPATKWRSRPWASFDQIVQDLIAHRKGNPALAQKFGWSTDYNSVADEVDAFNTRVCEQMGWTQFIRGGGGQAQPLPFPVSAGKPQRLGAVGAGGLTLVEWIKSKEEAVPDTLAEKRAEVCVRCPKNQKGKLLDFFTEMTSWMIRKAFEDRSRMNLSTIHDENLNVCSACYCPLKLKVHMGLDRILKRLPQESKQALDPQCWILSESIPRL